MDIERGQGEERERGRWREGLEGMEREVGKERERGASSVAFTIKLIPFYIV